VFGSIRSKAAGVLTLSAAVFSVSACKRFSDRWHPAAGESLRPAATAVLSAAADEAPAPATSRAPRKTVAASQRITIPAGSLVSGSMPGDRGRDPTLEPPLTPIEMGAFEIDRLPYPNDPALPPRTDVTRSQALQLCAERGQRLCTELEWERACKGPDNDVFPSGSGWDPECEKKPKGCASGFDVAAMGGAAREWTSSSIEPVDKEERTMGALRGGRANAADFEHRCARREPADPGAHGADIGLRCCSGPANAATIARPKPLQTFKRVQLDLDQANNMIQSVAQLASLGRISFFRDPEDVTAVLSKADAGRGANIVTTHPLMWSPDLGEEILVIAGKGAAGSSFIAAFHRLNDDRYRLASSFVLDNETPAIVLAFNGYVKNRITWSTCWGCLGEEGAISYRPDRRVVIEQF
jgi:formylglycine-generating enzyme required for sulfatase activity